MKTLHLTLHRKYFDAIASGSKIEEYREKKEFWRKRLEGVVYDVIKFRNGYHSHAPTMTIEFCGVGDGEFDGKSVYAIKLGRILDISNYDGNHRASS